MKSRDLLHFTAHEPTSPLSLPISQLPKRTLGWPAMCLKKVLWQISSGVVLGKGPFKYYVSKEVGGWGNQMLMFVDKVGGRGWPNAT